MTKPAQSLPPHLAKYEGTIAWIVDALVDEILAEAQSEPKQRASDKRGQSAPGAAA